MVWLIQYEMWMHIKLGRATDTHLMVSLREGFTSMAYCLTFTTYMLCINQSIKTQDQLCQWPNKPRP